LQINSCWRLLISHTLSSVISTPHYEAPIKKRDKTTIDPDSPPSLEIGPIGFKEKASRRLVDVPYCHIATPAINQALEQIRNDKRTEAREGKLKKPKRGATLLLRDADGVVETNHTQYVDTVVKGLTFRFQAGNFFQNNYMLPKMVDLVVDAATKPSAGGAIMTHLIDCYCGSGLFALGSSSYFDVCVGIEVNAMAVEEAKANAALNGIENCDFVSASAEAIFKSTDPVRVGNEKSISNGNEGLLVKDFPRDNTVVVVDPPRKGMTLCDTNLNFALFLMLQHLFVKPRMLRRILTAARSIPSRQSSLHEL
jgi:tRNA (uracil-5-)-methyltransferase